MEALVSLFLLGLLTLVAVPAIGDSVQRFRLRDASRHILTMMRQARMMAAVRGRFTALRFVRASGEIVYSLFEDGDGDGVLESDIRSGRDREISVREPLSARFPGVQVRILSRQKISKIPPARGFLENLDDPVKFGNSDLISFSPLGSSSSGTLYISSGDSDMVAIKLFGPTGRTQTWRYDDSTDTWTEIQ
jgi:type II secretory pathway pseudopilin PulG